MNLSDFQSDGKFLMLALDHRGSFTKLMNPQNPDAVSEEQAVALKSEIINALKDQFSGLLIDEVYGLQSYPQHQKPYLLPVEKSGFKDKSGERLNELEYEVPQLIEWGATGAKMLLFFNPDSATAKDQIELAQKILNTCRQENFPFFLEPVTYRVGDGDHTQDTDLVLRSLQMLVDNGVTPDVFKIEYPGSLEACHKVSQIIPNIPWILLTNPDSFDTFVSHLKDATQAGCKGFLAGRALWQEVCTLQSEEKERFLKTSLPERFTTIAKISKGM